LCSITPRYTPQIMQDKPPAFVPPSVVPRQAALALVDAVLDQNRGLSEILADPPDIFATLPPADRARAQRLALTWFRQAGRARVLLRPFLRKTPPDPVLRVMILAVTEVMVDDAPPHGVINDAVTLAQDIAPAFCGLVNAVLRRACATQRTEWDRLPPPRLPDWLRGALQNAWGAKGTMAIEAAHLQPVPLDLTLRDGTIPSGLDGQMLPTGNLRLPTGAQVTSLPGYEAGQWWVQDVAASLPVRLLGDVAGLRVLDICAAPGGKTLQLAAGGAQVTALDISGPRLNRLRANLARTGLQADIVTADALHWRPEMPYDAILLDAPCSATGTIRRHPELPLIRTRDDLRSLRALQGQLLDRVLDPAYGLLRAGGRVVYCTCSLLPAEGEDQLAAAMLRHPVQVLDILPASVPVAWRASGGGIRTRPDHWPEWGGMDGFFMAALQHMGR
jgi:16S rRNA (cytosine967-C5)-methyltransferase